MNLTASLIIGLLALHRAASSKCNPGDLNNLKEVQRDFVIPKLPKEAACVRYGDIRVLQGNVLQPENVVFEPTHFSWPADDDKLYTLRLQGKDSHDRHPVRVFNMWQIYNIPGNRVNEGTVLYSYESPMPFPFGHGFAPFVFTVYDQNRTVNIEDSEDRQFLTKRRPGIITAASFFKLKNPANY